MKRIYICSPYRGNVEGNVRIAQGMVKLALLQGHAPFAPHLQYPQVLSDGVPEYRAIGMKAGLEWLDGCDEIWIWGDGTMSDGMKSEVDEAQRLDLVITVITSYELGEILKEARQ